VFDDCWRRLGRIERREPAIEYLTPRAEPVINQRTADTLARRWPPALRLRAGTVVE
jgi:hypothetical protein